jgi:large subunit ribosomal protein L10
MPRPEKVQAVEDIKGRLEEARAVFVAEYAGLSVKDQQALRRGLRAANSEFKVFKMTLARRAASEVGHDDLLELLIGPTGLTFADDAAATAKVLRDFARDHERLVIKGALLGAEVLPPEKVEQLADLEPRDVLLAKIAGAFQAPMSRFAGLLAAMPRNLATMLQQLIEKTPDPAAEAPAGSADESAAAAAPEESGETTEEAATGDTGQEPSEESADSPAETADEVAEEADEVPEASEESANEEDVPTAEEPADQAEEE